MHEAPTGDEIVRSAGIDEAAESDGNDRTTRVIYAAGFFDGEGHVSLPKRQNGGRYLEIGVGQLDRRPLEALVSLFGGSITPETQSNGKLFYRWRTATQIAAVALHEMLPHLIVKREQAEIALEFHDERPARARHYADDKARQRETMRARRAAKKRGEPYKSPYPTGGILLPDTEKQRGNAYMRQIAMVRL